jgi:hypothetical protein
VVPPLRERREDILPLARQFLGGAAKRFGKKAPALAPKPANLLLRYTWPGNVRELENALERAVVLARGDRIGADDLPPEVGAAPQTMQTASEIRTLADLERDYIAAALRASAGNRAKAAQRLGIGAATLYRKLKRGTAITRSSVFGKRVVRIAIEPALTRLRRCDNRMPRRARVLRRVTVGRVVAAMCATALLTGTEMNPGSADLDALLALPSCWVLDAGNGAERTRGSERTFDSSVDRGPPNLAAAPVGPLLFLHGTEDKAAKSSGSQLFYDRAGSTDKTLKLYDGHFHDLLNDLGKQTVMADITAWIEARLLGGAKSGADH